MKKILMVSVGFAALGMAPAVAADLAPRMYTKAPPAAVAPIYNWTGFYAGAMGGFGKSDDGILISDSKGDELTTPPVSGGFGGATVGYNWQIDKYVFGVEADAAAADVNSQFSAGGGAFEDKLSSLGTVRGRVGVTFDQVLLYGTGGFAWTDERLSVSNGNASVSDSKFRTGWAAGAGMEVMFAPHWSMKAEYLYRSFGNETFFAGTDGALDPGTLKIQSGQVGVNYHF